MNDEKSTMAPIVLQHDQEILTGKQATDHFINSFTNISTSHAPEDRKKEVFGEQHHDKDINPFITTGTKQRLVMRTLLVLLAVTCKESANGTDCRLGSVELLNLLYLLWMKLHMVWKIVTWQKHHRLSISAQISCLCSIFTEFSLFFWLAKVASTSSASCSSHSTPRYSTEQAISMVMDDQSLNVVFS